MRARFHSRRVDSELKTVAVLPCVESVTLLVLQGPVSCAAILLCVSLVATVCTCRVDLEDKTSCCHQPECSGHCWAKVAKSIEHFLPHTSREGRRKTHEEILEERRALQIICQGCKQTGAIDGTYIQRLVDTDCRLSDNGARDSQVERHIKLLQQFSTADTLDANATLKQNPKAIQSRDLVKKAIVRFASMLGDACTISSSDATNVDPPAWEVQVTGHKKREVRGREKDYYTICCMNKTSKEAIPKYEVDRRWSELQPFLERKNLQALARASGKDLEKILGHDGVSTGGPPAPPKCRSSSANDRFEQLQAYFEKWNAWNEALRSEHGFSITELRCVWDYLSKQ